MNRRTLDDWLARLERQHPRAIDLGLERVREVEQRMGLGKPAACVITVGGTNGKGSTVAFVEAIARASGLRVGAYTSPHLLAYNERVRIDGRDVGDAELVEAFEAVEAARGDTSLTYFEHGTLAALWLFERADLDLAVLEVGLGGRLDAVNIVDADVAVVTTVDIDHTDWLGEDREAIGFEKAGIARAWTPLVLGEDDPPASVLRHAYAIGASAIRANCDFLFDTIDDTHWRWREPGFELALPMPRLAAPAQVRNAATAIAALRASDLAIADDAWTRGVAAANVPGRLQVFERDGIKIVVDVAHNPQAAGELAAWLAAHPPSGRAFAVFAALADKDVAGIVARLAARVDRWWIAGLEDAGPRGQGVDALAAMLADTAASTAIRNRDVAAALAAARAQARPGDRVLVFGSFHTAAAALRALDASGS
ncbi:bifunctional tetrahydrofolate synthase/dihydrofolate synthase [Pseudoluteimonas lycopersici]|uniref:bifunctional tetrahydrofolate synthase/dihydrofolate synthase n=1 Tax=Pseudoluteimonas lycopersici TaxID=1324796 RepID=UPI001FEA86E0|nr:bifunctional tetrahydrofolate synthase/dihydrofolate synthase [Lysobacter lycopersici]